MGSRFAWLVIAAACSTAACGRGNADDANASSSARARVGQPAPSWSEPSIPGPNLSLASLRGNAVYLNFFATWCPPCNVEAPAIDALARDYSARGLRVVGVDVLESAQKAAAFRNDHRLSYPVVVDTGRLRKQYEVNGLPVHVFIGRDGVVRKVVVGELSPAAMRSNVEAVLR
jgi:cytochrome c biogenesis protein CcmG, thiol:disulfide interchange protein DsbE